jgi:hypothetical protein
LNDHQDLRSNWRFNARRNERNSPEVALTKMAGRSVIASSDSGLAAFCTRKRKCHFVVLIRRRDVDRRSGLLSDRA